MENSKVFAMKFSKIYPLLIQKAEKKGRTKQEVDEVICWLTGYDADGLAAQLKADRSEERRVGKECVPRCRSRWSPEH